MKVLRNIFIALVVTQVFAAGAWAQVIPLKQAESLDMVERHHTVIQREDAINDNPLLTGYDVKFYGLDVEADNRSDQIHGNVTILVQVVDNQLSSLVFELINSLEVDRVEVDGEDHAFTHEGNEIIIPLADSRSSGTLVSTKIWYGGQTGIGMVWEVDEDWSVPVTYTSSEPFYSKDWFPCKEDLLDKADSVHVFVTTDYGLMAVSQGIHTGTTYFPNGKVRYEWKSNYPIAFYLISLSIADYFEYNFESWPSSMPDPILIQNFLYNVPDCLDTYRDKIHATQSIMDVFCERFGPYPFRDEKYGHYLWPRGGGMEHQTMTGMGNFEFYLVAHELGHSWFGNYVTCATWQDIWINEGFATFAGYLATEVLGPEYADGERDYRFERAMREPDGSVYIPAHEADNDARIFSGNLSYNKGMALVYMIRFELQNDDIFYETLRNFIERYANSAATGLDFKEVLEETSGMDFTDFFDQWYFGAGYPIYEVTWDQLDQDLSIHSVQTTSSPMTPLFKMSVEYRIYHEAGDTLVRVFHNENLETYILAIPYEVDSVVIDPDDHVLNKLAGEEKAAFKKSTGSHFSIYPNPNSGAFSFRSVSEKVEDVSVDIYTGTGKMIYSGSYEGCMPFAGYDVQPGQLCKGIYFVRIRSKTEEEVIKVLVE